MSEARDPTLDTLLLLDGEIFFADAEGRHFVKFVVKRVEPTAERPHGLSYSLTLHAENGDRLVGFDNAHRCRRNVVRRAQGGLPMIIGIGSRLCVPTTIATRQRFSRISGSRSTRS